VSLQVEEVKHELETIQRIARFAMPDIVPELKAALKSLPDIGKAKSLAIRMNRGGSGLIHYPALRALVSEP
jgi:hypothetical protein